MATLKATDGAAPAAGRVQWMRKDWQCNLSLPALGADGWIPPGRIWVSPTEYVLIVHSPRLRDGQSYRRRASRDMRYFVLHEFHNSTRNTDPFDTISSHSGSVFVPLYMSKQWTDAKGRRFVIVVQVAPYDVVSFHATDKGSAGPGMEVAKNYTDALEPLQGLAGILVATIVKTAAPQLEVVNHGGTEGLPMLTEYERRLQTSGRVPAQPPSSCLLCPLSAACGHGNRQARGPDRASWRLAPHSDRQARGGATKGRDAVRHLGLQTPCWSGPIRPAVRPATSAGEPGCWRSTRSATRPVAPATTPNIAAPIGSACRQHRQRRRAGAGSSAFFLCGGSGCQPITASMTKKPTT